MMAKRIIAWILVSVMLLPALCACKPDVPDVPDTPDGGDTTADDPAAPDGKIRYVFADGSFQK